MGADGRQLHIDDIPELILGVIRDAHAHPIAFRLNPLVVNAVTELPGQCHFL
jgi:hypothetical protein